MNTHPYRLAWQPSPIPPKLNRFKFWNRVSLAGLVFHVLSAFLLLASIPFYPYPSQNGELFRQIAFLFFVSFAIVVVYSVGKMEDLS